MDILAVGGGIDVVDIVVVVVDDIVEVEVVAVEVFIRSSSGWGRSG